MQKKARIIALVTVLVFLVGSFAPVGAAEGTKTLKALFKNLQIIVDGRGQFSDKEPFIVDGTTYVPIRMVAEATGSKVDWDGATGRVVITTAPSVDPAELTKKFQEGYDAGLKAGDLSGYLRGLEEGRKQVKQDADKKKEYDKGYKDGQYEGEKDGYDAGEYDYDRDRKSDWQKAIGSDSSITKKFKLDSKSEDYIEGFLDGYKDEFKSSYQDGYDGYRNSSDAYDNGWWEGYYEGYYQGEIDYNRNNDKKDYNDWPPSNSSIISQFDLNRESRTYQDDFIKGYKDNYSRGYDDGWYGAKKDPYRR